MKKKPRGLAGGKKGSDSASEGYFSKIKFAKKPLLIMAIFLNSPAQACITCNGAVREMIWNDTFFPNLLSMLSAFIILAMVVIMLAILAGYQYKENVSVYPNRQLSTPVPLTVSAMVLGIGLGGFMDGIVFHQILQWHGMVSNKLALTTVAAKSVNMFWDGIFFAFCLLIVLTGIFLLWRMLWRRDISRSPKLLVGGMLLGWGAFNIIEGVINHHVLGLHNVCEVVQGRTLWNLGFLAVSLLLLITGSLLVSSDKTTGYETKRRLSFNGSRKKTEIKIKS